MAAPASFLPEGSPEASYRRCRALAKRHGTTYYLSTFLLPREAWRHVWALYAFCRCADEIVDDLGPAPVAERERALGALGDRFFADLAAGASDDPVLQAVVATVRAHGIDPLAGVEAVGPARDLGLAFQLTNFLRDVAEDLDRGRVYLPREDLARFGADPARRQVDETWRQLMAFEIDRCRALYRSADDGLELLPPSSARCVRSARVLYAGILDRIETAGYDVFTRRARVPAWRKLTTVARELAAGLPPGGRPSPTGR